MCPNNSQLNFTLLRRQSGFSIVMGIFLLLIIAGLGVFMLSIYVSQQTASTQDIQGARAYQAAKAGIEWGTYQIMLPENGTAVVAPYACIGAMGTPSFSGALQNFAVSVSCSVVTTTEGPNTIRVYQIVSTASFGTAPSPDFIERQMSARIATCRTGSGTSPVCT